MCNALFVVGVTGDPRGAVDPLVCNHDNLEALGPCGGSVDRLCDCQFVSNSFLELLSSHSVHLVLVRSTIR